ncbi:MAG TPA: hypothetical protein VF832_03275, partial [Longimicrobiales bacterium]
MQGLETRLAEVLPTALAEVAPRLRVEPGRVWVDGRGLPADDLAGGLLRALASVGVEDARAGLADAPIVAWAACSPWAGMAVQGPGRTSAEGESGRGGEGGIPAASRSWASSGRHDASGSAVASVARERQVSRSAEDAPVAHSPTPPLSPSGRVLLVPPGQERSFLAPLPLAVLDAEGADPHVLELLAGVGVETCGALAALEREGVEVRFGAEGLRLWRLARGDDPRLLFQATPPERPQASLDFVDYVVTDPERLAFTVNALLGSICDGLRERGEHARRLHLVLELAGGGRWEQGLRPGRATASRAVWLRLARMALDRTTLPDAV